MEVLLPSTGFRVAPRPPVFIAVGSAYSKLLSRNDLQLYLLAGVMFPHRWPPRHKRLLGCLTSICSTTYGDCKNHMVATYELPTCYGNLFFVAGTKKCVIGTQKGIKIELKGIYRDLCGSVFSCLGPLSAGNLPARICRLRQSHHSPSADPISGQESVPPCATGFASVLPCFALTANCLPPTASLPCATGSVSVLPCFPPGDFLRY